MSNLIFQVCVGPTPPAFYEICIASAESYAARIGADHYVLREPELKIRPLNSHRSEQAVERLGFLPIYEKEVAFSERFLTKYDNIAIVDSDIFIRDTAPNIFEQMDEDAVFAGVLERDMPLTSEYTRKIKAYTRGQYGPLTDVDWNPTPAHGAEFFNMGLMMFSNKISKYLNGETPEQFIRRPEFERFVNGEGNWRWSTDQTLLNYWVKKSGMKVKHLEWKWNALFKGVRDEVLPQAHFLHFFLANNLPRKGDEIPSIIRDLNQAGKIKAHG